MWKVWKNKNVDLEVFATSVQNFFDSKGCVCRFVKSVERSFFKIHVRLPKGGYSAMVTIKGLNDGFKVEFVWERRLLQFLSSLASLFGGGIFVSWATKDVERVDLDCFEDEFWVYIENVIRSLSSS